MKEKSIVLLVVGLSLGLAVATFGFMVTKDQPAAAAQPTPPTEQPQKAPTDPSTTASADASAPADGSTTGASDPYSRDSRRATGQGAAITDAPPIAEGDVHDWKVCATRHYEPFVRWNLENPSLYVPKAGALGQQFLARWPEKSGLHLHTIGAGETTLATIWPEEESPGMLLSRVTPDVETILVVVPPSIRAYDVAVEETAAAETQESRRQILAPPDVVAIKVGEAPVSRIPEVREIGAAGIGGRYMVSPVNQNWFGFSLYGIRDLRTAQLRMRDRYFPPVMTVGFEQADGSVSWLYLFPWPENLAMEQARNLTIDVEMAGAAGVETMSVPAPEKIDVSVRPLVPQKEGTISAHYFGRTGGKYAMSLWVVPEPPEPKEEKDADGDRGGTQDKDEDPILEYAVWSYEPAGDEQMTETKSLEVSRSRTFWEHIAPVRVQMSRIWPN